MPRSLLGLRGESVPIALGTAGGHGGGVQPKAQVVQHVLQLLLKGHSATRLTAPTWVGSFSQTCNLTERNFSVLTVGWVVRAPTTVIQGALRHCAANARAQWQLARLRLLLAGLVKKM